MKYLLFMYPCGDDWDEIESNQKLAHELGQIIDEDEIRKSIIIAAGKELKLKFSYLNDIPNTSRGKHQFLIQKLKIKIN